MCVCMLVLLISFFFSDCATMNVEKIVRREKNRQAAQRYRVEQKRRMEALLEEIERLRKQNETLLNVVQNMQQQQQQQQNQHEQRQNQKQRR